MNNGALGDGPDDGECEEPGVDVILLGRAVRVGMDAVLGCSGMALARGARTRPVWRRNRAEDAGDADTG